MRVAHIITRMIVGGAQENTLLNCLDLMQIHGDNVLLVTGPALGPEGDLLRQGRGGEVPLAYLVEMLEDEEELGQLVEGVEAVAQFGPVTVLGDHPVAEAVDRGGRQFRRRG